MGLFSLGRKGGGPEGAPSGAPSAVEAAPVATPSPEASKADTKTGIARVIEKFDSTKQGDKSRRDRLQSQFRRKVALEVVSGAASLAGFGFAGKLFRAGANVQELSAVLRTGAFAVAAGNSAADSAERGVIKRFADETSRETHEYIDNKRTTDTQKLTELIAKQNILRQHGALRKYESQQVSVDNPQTASKISKALGSSVLQGIGERLSPTLGEAPKNKVEAGKQFVGEWLKTPKGKEAIQKSLLYGTVGIMAAFNPAALAVGAAFNVYDRGLRIKDLVKEHKEISGKIDEEDIADSELGKLIDLMDDEYGKSNTTSDNLARMMDSIGHSEAFKQQLDEDIDSARKKQGGLAAGMTAGLGIVGTLLSHHAHASETPNSNQNPADHENAGQASGAGSSNNETHANTPPSSLDGAPAGKTGQTVPSWGDQRYGSEKPAPVFDQGHTQPESGVGVTNAVESNAGSTNSDGNIVRTETQPPIGGQDVRGIHLPPPGESGKEFVATDSVAHYPLEWKFTGESVDVKISDSFTDHAQIIEENGHRFALIHSMDTNADGVADKLNGHVVKVELGANNSIDGKYGLLFNLKTSKYEGPNGQDVVLFQRKIDVMEQWAKEHNQPFDRATFLANHHDKDYSDLTGRAGAMADLGHTKEGIGDGIPDIQVFRESGSGQVTAHLGVHNELVAHFTPGSVDNSIDQNIGAPKALQEALGHSSLAIKPLSAEFTHFTALAGKESAAAHALITHRAELPTSIRQTIDQLITDKQFGKENRSALEGYLMKEFQSGQVTLSELQNLKTLTHETHIGSTTHILFKGVEAPTTETPTPTPETPKVEASAHEAERYPLKGDQGVKLIEAIKDPKIKTPLIEEIAHIQNKYPEAKIDVRIIKNENANYYVSITAPEGYARTVAIPDSQKAIIENFLSNQHLESEPNE